MNADEKKIQDKQNNVGNYTTHMQISVRNPNIAGGAAGKQQTNRQKKCLLGHQKGQEQEEREEREAEGQEEGEGEEEGGGGGGEKTAFILFSM